MGRAITWVVFVEKRKSLTRNLTMRVFDSIRKCGGTVIPPGEDVIRYYTSIGPKEYSDEAGLLEAILEGSFGLVTVWMSGWNFSLEFDPDGTSLNQMIEMSHYDDEQIFGTMLIDVDICHVRLPEYRDSFHPIVVRLFTDLCLIFDSPFAFALDEWWFDIFDDRWHVQREVSQGQIPSIVFPANYYSTTHFAGFEPSRLSLPSKDYVVEPIGELGFLVTSYSELVMGVTMES